MKTVDDYECIRKAYYLEEPSIREISRRLHLSRRLIRKAIDHAQPEGYRLKQERPTPVLAPYKSKIDALIKESEQLPRKQRQTGHKIYQLLQVEGELFYKGEVHMANQEQLEILKQGLF